MAPVHGILSLQEVRRIVTIKDIAKMANVSPGTVSNVLNGRGNVSLERTMLVCEAAEKLGYVVNAQAKHLRADSTRGSNVAVILPTAEDLNYTAFYNAAKRRLEAEQHNVLLFVTNGSPSLEKQIIRQAAQLRVSGALTISCCVTEQDAYAPLLASGSKLVNVLRDIDRQSPFVGFDLVSSGREIGRYLAGRDCRSAGALVWPSYYPDTKDFLHGLRDVLEPAGIPLQVVYADEVPLFSCLFEFFENGTAPEVLILVSGRMVGQVRQAAAIGTLAPCPEIIALTQQNMMRPLGNLTRYEMNFDLLGQQAAQSLLEQFKKDSKSRVIIPPVGFPGNRSVFVPRIRKELTLRLMMPKALYTDALLRMAPDFTKQTGIRLELETKMPSDMFQATNDASFLENFDVVRASMSTMPLINKDLFRTFDPDYFRQVTEGMFPSILQDFSTIGGECKAIPFDIGSEMLVYRKDMFEDSLLRRMFYEQTGNTLQVPRSYKEVAQISRFFVRENNPQSPVAYGTSIASDSVVELISGFTLRYLYYAREGVLQSRKAPVDVEAVCNVVRNMEDCSHSAFMVRGKNWIGATIEPFIHGQTAMEMVYLNYATDVIQLQKHTYGGQIGYAPMPNGKTYITGGSLLVPQSSRQQEAAMEFIRWVTHSSQSILFTMLGGISPHAAVYESGPVLAQYPWYSRLPELIATGCGRRLWDTLDVEHLERRGFPYLQALVEHRMSSSEVSAGLVQELNGKLYA